jgi:hypothetical protein
MSGRDPEGLFEVLEPPPGGLASLRERIRQRARRRSRARRAAAGVAAVAVLAFAALLLHGPPREESLPPGFGSSLWAIGLGLADPPSDPVSVPPDARDHQAVLRVPTTDDRVVFYLVGSR